MMVSARQTAEERRRAVLEAAVAEFARGGYAGTSTEAIAARAGISQPYLFRLFGTKKDLFIATYDLVAGTIVAAFATAADGFEGQEAVAAMGMAYIELMQDPDLLRVQLHAYAAAAADPDIAAACRHTFDVLWHQVEERTGMDEEALREFFAQGMLITVGTAIDLLTQPDPWARSFCPDPGKLDQILAATSSRRDASRAAEGS
jgi:AcrR family transcriptional regulator